MGGVDRSAHLENTAFMLNDDEQDIIEVLNRGHDCSLEISLLYCLASKALESSKDKEMILEPLKYYLRRLMPAVAHLDARFESTFSDVLRKPDLNNLVKYRFRDEICTSVLTAISISFGAKQMQAVKIYVQEKLLVK